MNAVLRRGKGGRNQENRIKGGKRERKAAERKQEVKEKEKECEKNSRKKKRKEGRGKGEEKIRGGQKKEGKKEMQTRGKGYRNQVYLEKEIIIYYHFTHPSLFLFTL